MHTEQVGSVSSAYVSRYASPGEGMCHIAARQACRYLSHGQSGHREAIHADAQPARRYGTREPTAYAAPIYN
jgi:hypothetical protein